MTLYRPYALASLAEALLRRGELTPALAAVREGFENMKATGERWLAPQPREAHRGAQFGGRPNFVA